MEVIILAGGMGTRLKTVVNNLPKPMAPVNNKPFLEYLLRWLTEFSISKIILSVGYKAEIISDYFGDNFQNIPLKYVIESSPLGTGGAIKLALNYASDANVIILNADTYFPIDLNEFLNFHDSAHSKLTIALKEMNNFDRYGTVEMSAGTIINFNEKKYCEAGLINAGIYALNLPFFKSLNTPDIFSFEKEILETQAENRILKGKVFVKPFIDIGIPEDYYRAGDIV